MILVFNNIPSSVRVHLRILMLEKNIKVRKKQKDVKRLLYMRLIVLPLLNLTGNIVNTHDAYIRSFIL